MFEIIQSNVSDDPQDAIRTITAQLTECRQRYVKHAQLLVPWPVLMCRLGIGDSVDRMLEAGPKRCSRRQSCFVDAMGRIFEDVDGEFIECERKRDGMAGRVYCSFPYRPAEDFKLWCLLAVYESFLGPKPANWKVEPLDGNHDNTCFDNLLIRVDPAGDVVASSAAYSMCGVLL